MHEYKNCHIFKEIYISTLNYGKITTEEIFVALQEVIQHKIQIRFLANSRFFFVTSSRLQLMAFITILLKHFFFIFQCFKHHSFIPCIGSTKNHKVLVNGKIFTAKF